MCSFLNFTQENQEENAYREVVWLHVYTDDEKKLYSVFKEKRNKVKVKEYIIFMYWKQINIGIHIDIRNMFLWTTWKWFIRIFG